MSTSTLQQEATFWHNFAINFRPRMSNIVFNEAVAMKERMKEVTPVDTGRMKQSWRVRRPTGGGEVIASAEIFNPISWSRHIEYGVTDGDDSSTWVRSYQKKRGKGGIVKRDGKLYSKYAAGGVYTQIKPAQYSIQMSRRIADAIISMVNGR